MKTESSALNPYNGLFGDNPNNPYREDDINNAYKAIEEMEKLEQNASGIMPTGWIPSFEELKNIAETAENEDT